MSLDEGDFSSDTSDEEMHEDTEGEYESDESMAENGGGVGDGEGMDDEHTPSGCAFDLLDG